MNEACRAKAHALANRAKELRWDVESLQEDEQEEHGVSAAYDQLETAATGLLEAEILLLEIAKEASE